MRYAMSSALDHLKSAAPPIGAGVAGWPWWAIATLLVVSCGPSWAMAWLDVIDRIPRSPLVTGSPATTRLGACPKRAESVRRV